MKIRLIPEYLIKGLSERSETMQKLLELKALCDSDDTWELVEADVKNRYNFDDIKQKLLIGIYSSKCKDLPPDMVIIYKAIIDNRILNIDKLEDLFAKDLNKNNPPQDLGRFRCDGKYEMPKGKKVE